MTMTFIASQTVSTNGSNVVFNSIPQNFSHLQVRVFGRGMTNFSDGLSLYLFLNGDSTSSNYVVHGLFGNGSSSFSAAITNAGTIGVQQCLTDSSTASNIFGVAICDILDYTSTVKNKTVRTLAGYDKNGAGRAMLYSGLWMASPITAVSSITASTDGGFASGTRIDLYGIGVSEQTGA